MKIIFLMGSIQPWVPKAPDAGQVKDAEKAFHSVRREHRFRLGFDRARITSILFKRVEVREVSTGPIHKKAEQLLENFGHRLSLATLTQASEEISQTANRARLSQKLA